jgi:hypothetical protein
MIYLKNLIVLIGRIIAATCAFFFIFAFVYISKSVVAFLSYENELIKLFEYHLTCYSLHIIPICEIHYFWLMGFWMEVMPDFVYSFLTKYGVFDFIRGIFNFVRGIFTGLYPWLFFKGLVEYGIPSFTAFLMFKFVWRYTKTESKTKNR